MRFRVNHRSPVPIYAQLVAAVRQGIARGEVRPGEQLPTVRQLAVDLKINANTVARAYQEMEHDGMITTHQGRGTFVVQNPPTFGGEDSRERLSLLVKEAVGEAAALGCAPEEFARAVCDFVKTMSPGDT